MHVVHNDSRWQQFCSRTPYEKIEMKCVKVAVLPKMSVGPCNSILAWEGRAPLIVYWVGKGNK